MMAFSYSETVTSASSPRHLRAARPTYVPPQLRGDAPPSANPNAPNPPDYQPFPPSSGFQGRGGAERGRNRDRRVPAGGRGRGRRSGRPRELSDPGSSSDAYPFDLAEQFEGLEVGESGGSGGGAGNGGINFDAYEDIPVETSGADVPPPADTFADIDLGRRLNENIRRCRYVKPTPVQRHAMPIAVAGRDLMACAQTGSGKTAAFCFPIISGILRGQSFLQMPERGMRVAYPHALILSPTRELSCQIHDEAKKFAYQTGVKIAVAYGGAPISQQFRNLERGVDILVATPGRLVDMIERARVSLSMVRYLALDEADRMLDMGFEPQIRRIVDQMDMPPPGARQTMLFSATFPDEIQRLACDFLSNYIFLAVGRVGSSTDLIAQKVDFVHDTNKRNHLMNLLQTSGARGKHTLTLVFVETKKGADALEHWLSMNGFPATAIHGDKVQMERERALKSFKNGSTPIMVATDVAARGLDVPHVAHVINFDLPKDIDDYVHRIGRTGRAGKAGVATAFFSEKNQPLAKSLVQLMQEANQEVPPWLHQYAERPSYGVGSRARYRGSRFGGRDFRSRNQSWGDSDSYANSYSDYAHTSNNYYVDGNAASYAAGAYGYGSDQGPVVASGWE